MSYGLVPKLQLKMFLSSNKTCKFAMLYNYFSLRRQYPPLSLGQLQTMIDTDRIDVTKPIDLATICNSGLYTFVPDMKEFGVHLTDEVSLL